MRIALLSHSYHKLTRSAEFLANILRILGSVEMFFDESWAQRRADWVTTFEPRSFDCIVILQAHECFQYVNPDHRNIVFVPMYDAMIWQGEFYWQETFNHAKILCFSAALSQEVSVRNPASVYFQYYPNPQEYPQVQDYKEPRGYYWRRTKEIGTQTIAALAKGFRFEHFTIHDVPDPGSSIAGHVHSQVVDSAHYAITGWQDSAESYLDHLSKHNIYFAPRIREGIGFGFLKAMSMGLCVVAPNTATHNEYIAQGCTGVLYQPDNLDPVDLRRYRDMGLRARDSMERGRRRWDARVNELLEFFALPTRAFQRRQYVVDSWMEGRHKAPPSAVSLNSDGFPSVAVVTVCLNARNEIEKTIRSVTAQDYPGLEYLIFDGGSTDGTVDVIRRHEQALAFWTSSPDQGVYATMQQSLDQVKSDWVLFMNAGDFFSSPDSLRRLFASAPRTAEIVYGHHIYRHITGVDELRLASRFGWMLSRLQEGNFDVEYPVGFPAHQATAIRTRLLRKLKFDPLFRIAADHDLLWRAQRHGAEFFEADEIISVYVGGGFSARQFGRCKQEWCVIALRYGSPATVSRLRNCTPDDVAAAVELDYGYRSDRFISHLAKIGLGRLPGFWTAAKIGAGLHLRTARRQYLLPPALHSQESGIWKKSRIVPWAFVQFTREGIAACLSEVRGLADPEEWGTWSEGKIVELVFRKQLPDSFTLILNACAFGPNGAATIPVTVGKVSRQVAAKGRRRRRYRIEFDCHGGADTIGISIPHPISPAELHPGKSSDRRSLGLGFVSLKIETNLPT